MQQNFITVILPIFLIALLLVILRRFRLKKLGSFTSPILGKIEVLQKYNGEKVLTTNSYPQGISIEDASIKKSYWYAIANEAVKFCKQKNNPQVLMLGLGANTIPNLIAKANPKIFQTIVEIDGYIIEACRQFFGLNELPNCRLIQTDAYKLFKKGDFLGKFDVIIVDIFVGAPPYLDIKSNQPPFIEKIMPSLEKDGMIIFNRPAHNTATRGDGEKLNSYLKTLFDNTKLLDIRDPRRFRNYVIMGSDQKI